MLKVSRRFNRTMAIEPNIPPNLANAPEPWLTGRRKLLISVAIVVLAMFYFAFQSFQGAAQYFYSVQELQAQGEALADETLRVRGKLLQESFVRAPGTGAGEFILVDDNGDRLQVSHAGAVPSLFFNPHSEIILQGTYDPSGVFITKGDPLIKCPTKFQELDESGEQSADYEADYDV
jgi:cytochrome c-type biogenesis protein CcmE